MECSSANGLCTFSYSSGTFACGSCSPVGFYHFYSFLGEFDKSKSRSSGHRSSYHRRSDVLVPRLSFKNV